MFRELALQAAEADEVAAKAESTTANDNSLIVINKDGVYAQRFRTSKVNLKAATAAEYVKDW